jgi:hypothetical protein
MTEVIRGQEIKVEEEIQRMEDEGGPAQDEPKADVPPDPNPEPDKPEPEEMTGPPVMVGPHPLGGIQLIARDRAGETVSVRLDLTEASMLSVHLNALMTMMFSQMYAQAVAQEQEAQKTARDIYIPRT